MCSRHAFLEEVENLEMRRRAFEVKIFTFEIAEKYQSGSDILDFGRECVNVGQIFFISVPRPEISER